jgi:hypothetical protein
MMFPSQESVSGLKGFGRLLDWAATGRTAPPQARTIGRTVLPGIRPASPSLTRTSLISAGLQPRVWCHRLAGVVKTLIDRVLD